MNNSCSKHDYKTSSHTKSLMIPSNSLDANILPTITILRMMNRDHSYSFKLMKQKWAV